MGNQRDKTLRELLVMVLKESLKDEVLVNSEVTAVVEYILHNSTCECTADKLVLSEGNYLGVNGDRGLMLPRFMTFKISKRRGFDVIGGAKRTWGLMSYPTFKDLEFELKYATGDLVAIIDGEIVRYEKIGLSFIEDEIIWEKDIYLVNYKKDGLEQQEFLRSKHKLEEILIQLVAENKIDIQAYNIIAGERIDFTIKRVIYTTVVKEEDEYELTWYSKPKFEDEEEEYFC